MVQLFETVSFFRSTRDHGSLTGMDSMPLSPETLQAGDAVLIVTDLSSVDYGLVAAEVPLAVDTRNARVLVSAPESRVVKA